MKGALIVCNQSVDLFGVLIDLADRRTGLEASVYDGSAQLVDLAGRRLTFFSDPVPRAEWLPNGAGVAELVCASSLDQLRAYEVECRWDDLFCEVVRGAAENVCIVVIDGNGEIHLPGELTPGSFQL